MKSSTPAIKTFALAAQPEPLQIDMQKIAVIVIDMQNAFVSKGGIFDLMGMDISGTPKIVEVINKLIRAARSRKVKVIYVVHHHSADMRETGGLNSGYGYKLYLHEQIKHPEWRDNRVVRGTWGAELVQGLEFKEDDIFVVKPRYSAFFGTNLDTILKTFNIKYLTFTGVATNMCVEATLRDASNLDYFPILISDATAPNGPPYLQDATIHNVIRCLGWVTTSKNILKIMK